MKLEKIIHIENPLESNTENPEEGIQELLGKIINSTKAVDEFNFKKAFS